MADRKVLNKYYPPDFDPAKLPRGERPKNDQFTVRMMMPMSVRCQICGEYIYRGKKFNSKKETVIDEEYFGVKIFRFYMRCPNCSSEFTIKTDPKNSDYVAENGCSRNFEPWRANEALVEDAKRQREEEETGDAMKALENRTNDSKIEMDIIDALEEIKNLNSRNAKLTPDQIIEYHQKRKRPNDTNGLTEEDLAEIQNAFQNPSASSSNSHSSEEIARAPESKKQKTDRKDEELGKEGVSAPTPVSSSSSSFIKVLPLQSSTPQQKKKPIFGVKITPKAKPSATPSEKK